MTSLPDINAATTMEMKLRTTPTGGVDASHSPYWRRLLSAGYKGFLQGAIGGASLYGTIGLLIGAIIAGGCALVPGVLVGTAAVSTALSMVGYGAGAGILAGGGTFGMIGAVAAIVAEASDLAEQRRYLLDRYYELPEGKEGDREAEAIRKALTKQHETGAPPHFFHWKTVVICAAIGAALAIGFPLLPATLVGHSGFIASITGIAHGLGAAAGVVGAIAGALTGAVVGIDRYYVRKWFDHTEGVIHSSSHHESALRSREQQIDTIKEAAKADAKTKQELESGAYVPPDAVAEPSYRQPTVIPTIANTGLKAPTHTVSDAALQTRIAAIQAAGLPSV